MAFLEGPLDEKEKIRHNQPMAREMAQAFHALDLILNEISILVVIASLYQAS